MENLTDIKFKVLKYALDHLEPNAVLLINNVLHELRLDDYIEDGHDIMEELDRSGLVKSMDFSKNRIAISRVTLQGKYFIENYLKDNRISNFEILDKAIENTSGHIHIIDQLEQAKQYLISNNSKDYRNAIKEAVGALESTLRLILNNNSITVGKALKDSKFTSKYHPAFLTGISAFYGFHSDSGAVRHGMKPDDFIPNYADAKYFVLMYSSFINYLLEDNIS